MLGLRVVLGKLQAILKTRSLPMEQMLRLLQTGELTAHALYPSKLIPEVPVPRHYWRSITVSELGEVRRGSSSKNFKGRYVIEVSALLDEYLSLVLAAKDPEAVRRDVRAAYEWEESECEVVVTDVEWKRFLTAKTWSEPEEHDDDADDDAGRIITGKDQRTIYSVIAMMAKKHYGFVVRSQPADSRRKCRDAMLSDLEKAGMALNYKTLDSLFDNIDKFDLDHTLVRNIKRK